MGRFYEFYDDQAESAMRLFGLRRIEARRGFRTQCGFPVNLQQKYLGRLLGLGFPVHVVREEESWLSGVKKRSVGEAWIPESAAVSCE
jgi:DNA mismatch repair ATPase MutS